MQIGLHIGKFDWPGSPVNTGKKLVEIATTADKHGFRTLSVMDHLFQLGTQYGEVHGPVESAMLEGYSTIAYLAAVTKQINLGLMVTCNFFREPGLLVKIVSTIDVLSGGRAFLGIGAGWFEQEAKGMGIRYPPVRERVERLEETLQIAKHMWSNNRSPYEGKYYHLAEPINSPQPLSKPHPRIMVGAFGEKKMLKLVAKYADAWNFVIGSPLDLEDFGVLKGGYRRGLDALTRKMSVLEQHCKAVNRPFSEIEKTVGTYIKMGPSAMSSGDVIAICRELSELGVSLVGFVISDIHEIEPLEILGEEVIPVVVDF
ncbi:MAG: LLM class F420-dependent oxidoreductase [Candidatus Odinarchaeota archaeon]